METKHIFFLLIMGIFAHGRAQDHNKLSDSPRHHEWVDLKRDNGTVLKAFVVYPESNKASKSVIVIHENRGLDDWARTFADELAAKGFLVIAPDLISNTVEGVEKTTDFENSDKAREAIYALDQEQVNKDLEAVYHHIKEDASANGEVSVIGFCWGGSQSFRLATMDPGLEQALVFYGTAPKDTTELKSVGCPVFGFYGGDDNRVNATIPATGEAMEKYGHPYEYEIYEGAGHAFMRQGAAANAEEGNRNAHDAAWKKLLAILE
jgi:carboxymethylenebutenolidase